MTRIVNDAAKAAKIIRQHLKAHRIQSRVRSSVFSMGSSITITLFDPMPATTEAVKQYVAQFQYGWFDGMTDSYEYSNHREDIPQAKYVNVEQVFTTSLQQEAWDYLRANFAEWQDGPAVYESNHNYTSEQGEWACTAVWQVLNGSHDRLCASPGLRFWPSRKPRIRAA